MHFPSEPTQNHHFFNRPTSKGPGQNEVSRVALKKLDAIVVPLEVNHVNLIIQVIAWSPHIQDHVWYPQMERHCKNVMVLLSLHLLYTHTSFRPTKHAYIKNKQNKTKKQYTSYEIFTGLKKRHFQTFPTLPDISRYGHRCKVEEPQIKSLTCLFFLLYLLCATQDIGQSVKVVNLILSRASECGRYISVCMCLYYNLN